MGIGLLNSVLCRHWLSADAVALWEDEQTVATWIAVEKSLAAVQAQLGLIPTNAAEAIAQLDITTIDFERLREDIAFQQHPFTPVLRQLEAALDDHAAGYLHWGATTQNIFDTAHALQMARTHALIASDLGQAMDSMRRLALAHKATPQSGRTHGQHALPITFGLKVASWHEEIGRHLARLQAAAQEDFAAVMGGAAGTFAAMQGQGREVQLRLASLLGLSNTQVPVRSSNDRMAHYVSLLALMGSTIERIAREVVFLQRTEIAEVSELHYPGKMGSSTMAQKRNPSNAMNLIGLAARLRACGQLMQEGMLIENEGFSAHSNLNDVTTPEAAVCAASLAHGLTQLIEGLQVNEANMRANLDRTRGQIMSEAIMMELARAMGRHHAHDVLYRATGIANQEGVELLDVLKRDPQVALHLSDLQVRRLQDPRTYLGECEQMVGALSNPDAHP